MNRKKVLIQLLAFCLFSMVASLWADRDIQKELLPEEYRRLLQGQLITKTREIKGEPWPELTLYLLIRATPEQCAAIFSYFPDQAKFSEGVLESGPVKQITPTLVHVAFKIDMPWPIADSVTITRNQLSSLPQGGIQVKWELVKSNTLKKNLGIARFIPYQHYTIYRYQNFVLPSMSIAGMFKNKMITDTQKSVQSFAVYVTQMLNRYPSRLEKLVLQMKEKLAGVKTSSQ